MDKTKQPRNKATENSIPATRSVTRSTPNTDPAIMSGKPQDDEKGESGSNKENKMSSTQEKDLLDKMSDIMKVARAEALTDMKKTCCEWDYWPIANQWWKPDQIQNRNDQQIQNAWRQGSQK